jgi:protein-disulfide isomerase
MASKRLTIREKRRKQLQQQRLVTVLIVVGVALVITTILVLPSLRDALAPVGEITPVQARQFPNAVANNMGDPNAPVKIVQYSDFQCPACKQFFDQTEAQLIEEYVATGKVYYTYRSMGLWIGPESERAAQAAYCAGDQGKYWEYHNLLFANQGAENAGVYSDKRLVASGELISLDMAAFNSCFDSGKYKDQVLQDQADGRAAGVTGTPSFLVNGKLLKGAVPFATLQQEIEAALGAAGSQ